MRTAAVIAALALAQCSHPAPAQTKPAAQAHDGHIPAGNASLYFREIGKGKALIVLHGGPDFDHAYLLPELDRWSDAFRLIYYDQRGRGRSAAHVSPQDVTLGSDIEDVDLIRRHFQLSAPALVGHSWGTVLALEYALRHPERVSHLVLMNPAPASTTDLKLMRRAYLEKLGPEMDRQRTIVAGAAYQAGDPEAVTARYRIHFKPALVRKEDYELLMARMQKGFTAQGKDGILKARAVENQLMRDTWDQESYDLMPKLRNLHIPTLVIAGDHDFIPAEIATHIASSIPNARLVTLQNCGHFSYLECPGDVRSAVDHFFGSAGAVSPTAAPTRPR